MPSMGYTRAVRKTVNHRHNTGNGYVVRHFLENLVTEYQKWPKVYPGLSILRAEILGDTWHPGQAEEFSSRAGALTAIWPRNVRPLPGTAHTHTLSRLHWRHSVHTCTSRGCQTVMIDSHRKHTHITCLYINNIIGSIVNSTDHKTLKLLWVIQLEKSSEKQRSSGWVFTMTDQRPTGGRPDGHRDIQTRWRPDGKANTTTLPQHIRPAFLEKHKDSVREKRRMANTFILMKGSYTVNMWQFSTMCQKCQCDRACK